MSSSKRALTFLRRRGHDLRVRVDDGKARDATITKLGKDSSGSNAVVERGSFAFGYCKACDWTGPGRRARDKARRDARQHVDKCARSAKVRVGVLD